MSKEIILNQMETIVNIEMTRFQSDFFKYDKPAIEKGEIKFPFIWVVDKTHTHLLPFSNYIDTFFESEAVRYEYIRNDNPYSYYFQFCFYADKLFIITEDAVKEINRNEALDILRTTSYDAACEWIDQNGPLPKLTKVPVKFKNITLSELKTLIADCRAHGDDSLFECFKRRHKSCRVAADQFTEITWHKGWNEFTFCEYINHKEGIEGHIVFHGWPETGYQNNGAFQVVPDYGWSSHT